MIRVTTFTFLGVRARQSSSHEVISIAARASEVLQFARIDRAGRTRTGALTGFQRPQIASHISEIRDYLRTDDAVLPNPIVVAFVGNVEVKSRDEQVVEITIRTEQGQDPPGFVVDGQQRLTALSGLPERDFQIFVSILVCPDVEELRRQFVLINSTRPLPKALIYELLPGVRGLPKRLTSRSFAATLTERLNFDCDSSLRGMIFQHTNPAGVIRDTALQKVIMQSMSDGAIREFPSDEQFGRGFNLISEFFAGVQSIFPSDWTGHNAKTSRLVHGAGIVAMGFVMETVAARHNARTAAEFAAALMVLKERTAWTSGYWQFSETERVPWNAVENTPRQIMTLAQHLVSIVRRAPPSPVEERGYKAAPMAVGQ
jgi:DGQHR domain-containing protein